MTAPSPTKAELCAPLTVEQVREHVENNQNIADGCARASCRLALAYLDAPEPLPDAEREKAIARWHENALSRSAPDRRGDYMLCREFIAIGVALMRAPSAENAQLRAELAAAKGRIAELEANAASRRQEREIALLAIKKALQTIERAEAENAALRAGGALVDWAHAFIAAAPTDADFAVGGRFDYRGSGNCDDDEAKGAASTEHYIAKQLKELLASSDPLGNERQELGDILADACKAHGITPIPYRLPERAKAVVGALRAGGDARLRDVVQSYFATKDRLDKSPGIVLYNVELSEREMDVRRALAAAPAPKAEAGGQGDMRPVLYHLDDGRFARAMLVGKNQLVVDLTTGDGPSVIGKSDWFAAGYVAAYGGLVPECAEEGTQPGQWSYGVAKLPEFERDDVRKDRDAALAKLADAEKLHQDDVGLLRDHLKAIDALKAKLAEAERRGQHSKDLLFRTIQGVCEVHDAAGVAWMVKDDRTEDGHRSVDVIERAKLLVAERDSLKQQLAAAQAEQRALREAVVVPKIILDWARNTPDGSAAVAGCLDVEAWIERIAALSAPAPAAEGAKPPSCDLCNLPMRDGTDGHGYGECVEVPDGMLDELPERLRDPAAVLARKTRFALPSLQPEAALRVLRDEVEKNEECFDSVRALSLALADRELTRVAEPAKPAAPKADPDLRALLDRLNRRPWDSLRWNEGVDALLAALVERVEAQVGEAGR